MSTSDKGTARTIVVRYAVVAAFCGIFSAVYEHFSHGVYSGFMVFLFAFPLVLGVVPALLACLLPHARIPVGMARDAWGSAVATLTFGSCLEGIFEIYGSTSAFVLVYWIVGAALAVVAVVAFVLQGRNAMTQARHAAERR